jgi:hypothetical protein
MRVRMRVSEMAIKMNGELIAEVEHEFGVRWPSLDDVWPADSEDDAREVANETHGELMVRTVYITGWSGIEPVGART